MKAGIAREAAVCLGIVFAWLLAGTVIGVTLDVLDGDHTGIIYVLGAWAISAVLALLHVAVRLTRYASGR